MLKQNLQPFLPESAIVSSSHATVYELLGLQLAKEKS